MLLKDNTTFNYLTNEKVVNQHNFSCNSKKLVYMICCSEKNCQFQYTGKTKQAIKSRMNAHRTSLRTKKGCQFVIEHFTKVHRPSNMKVAPIDPDMRNEMDLIKGYGTLFPYGGNDRLEQPYLDAKEWFDDGKSVWNLFTHKKSKRGKRGGVKHTGTSDSTASHIHQRTSQDIIDKVIRAKYDGLNYRILARNYINVSNKETVLDIGVKSSNIRDKYLKNVVIDLCRHYFSRSNTPKPFVKEEYIVFTYTNRYLEDLNLANLCNMPDTLNSYPCVATKLVPSFRYTKPIRNKILNYTSMSCDTENPPPNSCDCDCSSFKDPSIGHIVTGDLSIIENRKLRNLVSKGLTFRECYKFKKKDVLSNIEKDLDTHIEKQSARKNILPQCFSLWKNDILCKVRSKLNVLKIKQFKKPSLMDKEVKAYLKDLHDKYVLVPTDKASSNISVVCKKYYHQCMIAELSSDVYEKVQQSEATVVESHKKDLKNFDLEINDDDDKVLPFMYSTTKQHKSPISNRFIVSGKKCSMKILSKSILKVFQLVGKTMKTHCQYKCKYAKTKAYWVIKNANDIRNDIQNINSKHKASSLFSYDFERLYTNIPHDLLKENLKFALDEAFDVKGDAKYIKINKRTATWATKKPKNTKVKYVDKEEIMFMLQYLLNNIYVKYKDSIFRQIIGVPMGTDCAPDLANLFLFVFEYKYVMNLISEGDPDLRLFQFVYRYIDDLLILNDDGHFDKIYKTVYPSELHLKSTGISSSNGNFLDMNISCDNQKLFNYTLYDKRNDFGFKVISMPNLSSNIPINQAYGVFYSQIVRIFNANNTAHLFIRNIKLLIEKMCHQNFNLRKLYKYLNKFLKTFQFRIITKYWTILNCSVFK